jgi:hypothetical protein
MPIDSINQRAFLLPQEIAHLKMCLSTIPSTIPKSNHFLPYRFPDIDWADADKYTSLTTDFLNELEQAYEEIIGRRMNRLVEGYQFRSLNSMQGDFLFNPFTVRYQQPEQVDIYHHVENQAVAQFPAFYDKLAKYIEVYDQLSFVIMLQKPERGGEIILFDEYWEGESRVQAQWDKLLQMDKNNTIEQKVKHRFELEEGELLIFPAGQVWHRVGEVYGNKPRITLGGFMGKNKNKDKEYLFWS